VGLAPAHADPQGDRAARGRPDHAARGLGGEHGQRVGVDQAGVAQMAGARSAAGFLVADEVEDDAAAVEEAELACGPGAVEHAHQPALHVGGAAPEQPAVAPLRSQLRRVLHRDDVEVPVEVDGLGAVAHPAAHDARLFELAARRQREQLRGEVELGHRVA